MPVQNLSTEELIKAVTGFELDQLKELFELEDFKGHACAMLADAGCRPPLNHAVFWALNKAVFAGASSIGDKSKKVLFWVLEKTPGVRGAFEGLLKIARKSSEKEQVRQSLLAYLRERAPNLPNGAVSLDHTTDLSILTFLYEREKLSDLPAEIRKELGSEFEALRKSIQDGFADLFEPKLFWPEASKDSTGVIDSLFFGNERDEFVGREGELDLLERFIGTPDMWVPGNRFRWILLTGPGGEGKSRLALHFSKYSAAKRGWAHGRIGPDDIAKIDPDRWQPRKPTLITIDYAARRPEAVGALIAGLARNRRQYDFPVRLILLERDLGQWFTKIVPEGGDRAAVENTAFIPREFQAHISPVMEDAIIALMKKRFAKAGLEPPPEEALLAAAFSVDRRSFSYQGHILHLPRPLLAAAAAQAMIDLAQQQGPGHALPTELDRDKVLARLIEHDRQQRWLPALDGDTNRLALHENLLLLATFAQGLDIPALRGQCPTEALDLLPDLKPKGASLLSKAALECMGGFEDGRIHPLEPDILGEFFVLQRIGQLKIEEPDAANALIEAGFRLGVEDAIIFLFRCAKDFNARWQEIGRLEPLHDKAALAQWAEALAIYCIDQLRYGASLQVIAGLLDEAREAARRSGDQSIECHCLTLIGDNRNAQGDLAGALMAYEAGLAIAEALARTDPLITEWQRDLSVSHNKIGDVRTAQGDLAGALKAYEASLAIAEALARTDPRNTEWQRDLCVSHNKIGNVRTAQGDLAGALKAYEAALAIAQALARTDPLITEWQRDLSVSHNKIGDVRGAQGDLAGALKAYEAGLAIRKILARMDTRNTDWQRDLSVSHERIGDVCTAQGNLVGALLAYRDSLAIRDTLARWDQHNTQWQRDLSVSRDKIGDIHRAQGDLAGALLAYQESLAIAQKLAAADPANAAWQRDLSISHERIGSIHEKRGENAQALEAYKKGLEIDERLAALDPTNATWRQDVEVSRANVHRLTPPR